MVVEAGASVVAAGAAVVMAAGASVVAAGAAVVVTAGASVVAAGAASWSPAPPPDEHDAATRAATNTTETRRVLLCDFPPMESYLQSIIRCRSGT